MVLSRVWGCSGVGEEQEELGQVGCGCCFEFGRKSFWVFLMLFVTRLRAGDCQVEADRKLFWDWLFPLPGSWHRAPCLTCSVITAVTQLLTERAGRMTYLWKMNWLKFPLCPIAGKRREMGWGLCQEVLWNIWMQLLVLGDADSRGEAARRSSTRPFGESFGHKITP